MPVVGTRCARAGRRLGWRGLLLCALTALLTVVNAVAAQEGGAPRAPPPAPPAPPGPQGPAPQPPQGDKPAPAPFPGPEQAGRRVGREQMWPAPTVEDWKKPCLITWQRTWEDAVAVARETGKAILVCINMDGEIASEHYAGVRYRQPEITALYEPYVTVIASVYRHSPRDHDDEGRRIPCPRFGGVTCGEHIAIEPGIFEKFCDGKRIAPRHIMVELDETGLSGKETYDVYYRNDTASVFQAIQDGIARRTAAPKPPIVRGDRPLVERVASRAVEDRVAVEAAYAAGDRERKRVLLEAALKHGDAAQLDLLRLAVFGLDSDLSKAARQALTKVETPDATGLVAEALRVPMDAAERDALIATLKRLGASSVLARWLAVVHQGLASRPAAVDPTRWTKERASQPADVPTLEGGSLPEHVELKARAARERPDDPEAQLVLAEALLSLALETPNAFLEGSRRARLAQRALLDDAVAAVRAAETKGAKGWRLHAAAALSAYYGGDLETGYARAATAVKELPAGDTTWTSMAVLTVFAESRWKAIKRAVKERLDFPPEWLTDVHAAYAVLLRHPLGTDGQVLWHYDTLDWLGAADRAERVLVEGVGRFQDSTALHERLRLYAVKRHGVDGIERTYDTLRKEHYASASLLWFSAMASTATAEHRRRAGAFEAALAAYGRALAHYERVLEIEPGWRDEVDAAVALLFASRARVGYQQGEDTKALEDLLASFARAPGAAGTRDGMGITPGETAQMLRSRLKEQGRAEPAARLDAALAKLDPDLLRFDRE